MGFKIICLKLDMGINPNTPVNAIHTVGINLNFRFLNLFIAINNNINTRLKIRTK